MPNKVIHPKQISERRRQQNKQAQKNYRERQKRTLQTLQDIAGSRNGLVFDQTLHPESRDTPVAEWESVQDAQLMPPGLISVASSNGKSAESPYSTCSCSFPHLQSVPTAKLLVTPNRGIHTPPAEDALCVQAFDRVQTLVSPIFPALGATLPSPGSSEDCDINGSLIQPETETLEDALERVGKRFTTEQILKAGLKALSRANSLQQTSEDEETATSQPQLRTDKILVFQNSAFIPANIIPDLRKNNFRVKQVMWVAACVANATHLGLTFTQTSCDDAKSPFFRHSISDEAARTTCQASFRDLKEHLRPVPIQITHQHHPYIDVLPFPIFRERLIKLAYSDTPMIDEDDLCHDLENDGLICWGSSLGGGSVVTGSGAPWDIRSWEAQPWFLRKWWIVIGGAEGELYKQTQWWREMRGERSCYPW